MSTPMLLADWGAALGSHPLLLSGIVLGAVGLCLALPGSSERARRAGVVLQLSGLGLLAASLPLLGDHLAQVVFWLLAAVTVASAAMAIAVRSAIYCAIWFALSLLGTAGLFVSSGAQFLGVATVVVYAGAIVVTFLFVIMLAQPEGHAPYDRITWGWYAKPLTVLAAALLVAIVALAAAKIDDTPRQSVLAVLPGLRDQQQARLIEDDQLGSVRMTRTAAGETVVKVAIRADEETRRAAEEELKVLLSEEVVKQPAGEWTLQLVADDVGQREHVARLGGELFRRHLVSVEVAGTLLLAALVGAVAIVMQSRVRMTGSGADE